MDKQRQSIAAKQRAVIAERWTEQALAVYPPNTVRLFLAEKDRFRNPVGEAIRRNLTLLLDTVLSDESLDHAAEALDEIIRIRSVQELSAADAIRFVLELKQIVRDTEVWSDEFLRALDSRIDELALRAFDTYVGCREDVFRVRANQERAYSAKLIQRAESIIHGHLSDQVSDANSEDNGMIQRGEHP